MCGEIPAAAAAAAAVAAARIGSSKYDDVVVVVVWLLTGAPPDRGRLNGETTDPDESPIPTLPLPISPPRTPFSPAKEGYMPLLSVMAPDGRNVSEGRRVMTSGIGCWEKLPSPCSHEHRHDAQEGRLAPNGCRRVASRYPSPSHSVLLYIRRSQPLQLGSRW